MSKQSGLVNKQTNQDPARRRFDQQRKDFFFFHTYYCILNSPRVKRKVSSECAGIYEFHSVLPHGGFRCAYTFTAEIIVIATLGTRSFLVLSRASSSLTPITGGFAATVRIFLARLQTIILRNFCCRWLCFFNPWCSVYSLRMRCSICEPRTELSLHSAVPSPFFFLPRTAAQLFGVAKIETNFFGVV